MRALAAVVILAACSLRCRAHNEEVPSNDRDGISRFLDLIGVSPRSAIVNAVECSQTIGPLRCLAALSIWRAENALDCFKRNQRLNEPKLAEDIRRFPWQVYANTSQDEIKKQLCDGIEKLLQYRALKFESELGYALELASSGNGTLTIDIIRDHPLNTSRGMKKTFYNIVPYLLLPGLLMSAVLPFILPALKMMTMFVGMLNNMALSGAVFTLLRNNAFNDKYEKKVIYVNEGYRNEELLYKNHDSFDSNAVYEVQYDEKHNLDMFQGYPSMKVQNIAPAFIKGADFDTVEESPASSSNLDWIKQYYGLKSSPLANNN